MPPREPGPPAALASLQWSLMEESARGEAGGCALRPALDDISRRRLAWPGDDWPGAPAADRQRHRRVPAALAGGDGRCAAADHPVLRGAPSARRHLPVDPAP